MKNGFIKVAAARPAVCVADCKANLEAMKSIFAKALDEGVRVLVYPELCVTGYTCADLFFSDVLLRSATSFTELVKVHLSTLSVACEPEEKIGACYIR